MTFQPITEEIRALFPRTEQKVQEPTSANIHDIKDDDFDNFDDFVSEMMSSFRFTGFNPEDFRHYLLHRVFVSPKFSKSQAEAAICAIIVLFITRGNKLNTKNAGRMPQAGKDIIAKLQETLGTIFRVKYESNELDDTTITPARVAATFPSVTVNLIQQHSTRVVGNAPIGMPKGLASSFAFSVVPASCTHLLEAMGIWRDSFTLIINPKARSAGAQFLAQSSAYNFSRLALDSSFVSDSVRIKTVASVAIQQFSKAVTAVEKFLILYWVDLPEFIEAVTRTLNSTTPIAEAQNQLSKFGISTTFIQKLTPRARSSLSDLMTALSKSMSAEEKQLVNDEVSRRSIERRFSLDDVVKVGTLGGRDQGRTFESEATARFASINQPGLSLMPTAQPTPTSLPTAVTTLPAMVPTPGATIIL